LTSRTCFPKSPEDLLRKLNPASAIFLLFSCFTGFGALEKRSLKHNKREAGLVGALSLVLMEKADVLQSCGAEHESGFGFRQPSVRVPHGDADES